MGNTTYYKGITHSAMTQKKRNELKRRMDKFTSFSWRGYDAFDNFGAFIINEKKGSLQFYNGPGFSNEYSKPQFDTNGGDLIGVTVNRQQINFTIGVYWICIEDYRKFLDWLDYKTVSFLTFGYEPRYRYNVKLASIGDSTKYIIGKENDKEFYYTELKLTFEVQGKPCAIATKHYEYEATEYNNGFLMRVKRNSTKTNENGDIEEIKPLADYISSDLDFPFKMSTSFSFNTPTNTDEMPEKYRIILKAEKIKRTDDSDRTAWTNELIKEEEILLYQLDLKNLTVSAFTPFPLNITYQSDTGLLFLTYGNSNGKLLNLLNLEDTGQKIVDLFICNKFLVPGVFSWGSDFIPLLRFSLEIQEYVNNTWRDAEILYVDSSDYDASVQFESYARTNIA